MEPLSWTINWQQGGEKEWMQVHSGLWVSQVTSFKKVIITSTHLSKSKYFSNLIKWETQKSKIKINRERLGERPNIKRRDHSHGQQCVMNEGFGGWLTPGCYGPTAAGLVGSSLSPASWTKSSKGAPPQEYGDGVHWLSHHWFIKEGISPKHVGTKKVNQSFFDRTSGFDWMFLFYTKGI